MNGIQNSRTDNKVTKKRSKSVHRAKNNLVGIVISCAKTSVSFDPDIAHSVSHNGLTSIKWSLHIRVMFQALRETPCQEEHIHLEVPFPR